MSSDNIRILFVDDEPRILRGLRRKLGPTTNGWDIDFAETGSEALDMLQAATPPFEVIVTDLRMPGMNGVDLLTAVKKDHPHLIRIVLSGQADKETAMNAVGLAHQYLSKPCDTETLKATLAQAFALRDLLASEQLIQLASQIETLPSLPSLYQALMQELQSPRASIKKAGQIIAQDIGMTAKILQLVNSAFFGLPRRISDPTQAVILLGLDTVKALVLSAHIFSEFDQAKGKISPHFLREHSLAVGTCAKRITQSESGDRQTAEHAFTAGLLHDVGKLILAANLPQDYDVVLTQTTEQEISLPEAERQIFGASHAEVGAYLLGLWGLPTPIIEAVAFHHKPVESHGKTFGPLTAIHVANAFVNSDDPIQEQDVQKNLDSTYLNNLNLTDKLPAWQKFCQEVIKEKDRRE